MSFSAHVFGPKLFEATIRGIWDDLSIFTNYECHAMSEGGIPLGPRVNDSQISHAKRNVIVSTNLAFGVDLFIFSFELIFRSGAVKFDVFRGWIVALFVRAIDKKVAVVGASSVGKTSLCHRLRNQDFSENMAPTLGAQ